MYTIIGTCSRCGGPVAVPKHWACILPPTPTCQQCGAVAAAHGPVIPMQPAPAFTVVHFGTPKPITGEGA